MDLYSAAVLTLPSGLTTIESEAFSALTLTTVVRIPETVTEIADDAFDDSNVIILAPEGSYAFWWTKSHNFKCYLE